MAQAIEDYIFELEKYLADLPAEDRQDVIEFYREFLLDGDFVRRSTIEQELGSPRQLAHKILADYSTTDEPRQEATHHASKLNLKAIWYILLGICAAPIGIPIVIAFFAIILAVLALCLGLFSGIVAIFLALIVSGGAILVKAFTLLFTSKWAAGCFYIGAVLIICSLVMVVTPAIGKAIDFIIAECTRLIRYLGKKVFNNQYYRTNKKEQEKK
ncbi:DUF1700 domain-containing protein [Lactobacillus xylocopicola]|uniref:Membrane protein n=1 Tax=Lactobacillus xylocopicola TaxID=2976676 RepID=A0ABN6SHN9_9LACO|nr:DUF1700 domain-containing protein [Lactobacillus xylocopicola]BDR59827.1 membrane protein [Lactobacillus xylocopicola]